MASIIDARCDVNLTVQEQKPHDRDEGKTMLVEVGHGEQRVGSGIVECSAYHGGGIGIQMNTLRSCWLGPIIKVTKLLQREVAQHVVQMRTFPEIVSNVCSHGEASIGRSLKSTL
jgi:hypothetical protein